MRNLILKDLILNKKFLIGIGIFYVIYMGYFGSRINNPRLAIIIGAFMCALIPLMTVTREDKFKAALLTCSLPATRKQIIQARYVLGWMVMTAVYGLIVPVMVLFPGSRMRWASVAGVPAILAALAFLTLFFAFLMPFLIRFGLVGMFSFLVGLQLLGIAALALQNRGILSFSLKEIILGIRNALQTLNQSLGTPAYVVILLATLILINLASLTLSVALFRRKDL
ncbi:MAG: hypothetical protein A2Y56_03165 [Candidatus Aminicenantes bacterium RBG_13_63_10]|nr:MAG: hypothetical protein A2Y56_03165 [Candidatus Aminicenantes bacterium RBG_13_63_10]